VLEDLPARVTTPIRGIFPVCRASAASGAARTTRVTVLTNAAAVHYSIT
jgi:hypothetical protein